MTVGLTLDCVRRPADRLCAGDDLFPPGDAQLPLATGQGRRAGGLDLRVLWRKNPGQRSGIPKKLHANKALDESLKISLAGMIFWLDRIRE